jgi:ATP-binding cassette subfamily C protein
MALFQPWSGQILYDGLPTKSFAREVFTRSLATVDQDIFLFSGTIRENLTLWDDSAAEEAVIRACKDACIHEEIIAMPLGYETLLVEGGKNLSAGQRQRLEIARALIVNPTLLILDEATNCLDGAMEQTVMENIRRRGATTLVIAHRVSTIRDADEILVLDQGFVVQRGTHATLVQQEGLYRMLMSEEESVC